jgi:hypothetical protein
MKVPSTQLLQAGYVARSPDQIPPSRAGSSQVLNPRAAGHNKRFKIEMYQIFVDPIRLHLFLRLQNK